jgi:hypothetical protein
LSVFYFTELLGLAMGMEKEAEGWWRRQVVTPVLTAVR